MKCKSRRCKKTGPLFYGHCLNHFIKKLDDFDIKSRKAKLISK